MMKNLRDILAAAHILPELNGLLGEGDTCVLVGGALRNYLSGVPITDFDFATPEDPTPLARKFARAVAGKWFILDKKRRQSRVVAGGLTYDFAPFRGPDLNTDLCRRDFTINALALSLAGSFAEKNLYDPLGGRQDLAAGRLRVCSPEAFHDDPCRIMKGVRHLIHLSLEPDPATWQAMREAVPGIERVAAERLREETGRILAAPEVVAGFDRLCDLGLAERLFGPGGQGGHSGGTTLLQRWLRTAEREVTEGGEEAANFLAEEVEAGWPRRSLMGLAAYLRGRGAESAVSNAGRLRLSRRSSAILEALLELPVQRCRELERLACGSRGRALWCASLGTPALECLLFLPVLADDGDSGIGERIQKVLNDFQRHSANGRVPDLVDGDWLRAKMGLEAGPQIGRLLRALRREEIAGRVRTAGEARKFLESQVSKTV